MPNKWLMKRLYFDVCTLCRPFDDQNGMRVRLETDACYLILQAVKNRKFELIMSQVHFAELEAIDDPLEREQIKLLLNQCARLETINLENAKRRAEDLVENGFGIGDAAHLAWSEQTADFFLTCDDRLLKRCRRRKMDVEVLNPVEFCARENLR